MNIKKLTIFAILGIALLGLCLLSMRYGSVFIDTGDFFSALLRKEGYETRSIIIYSLRLPRVIGGILAGVGLGVSGVLLQSVTGNKMASPGLIGVNSGAGFAVILALSLPAIPIAAIPFISFTGASLATLAIIAIAGRMGMTKNTVVLSGIAFSAILSAGISLLSLLDSDVLVGYNAFAVGSLAGIEAKSLTMPAVLIVSALLCALFAAQRINLLSLGAPIASSLGLNVRGMRIFCMLLASALAGAAVSVVGLLGFVGLMSPHIARALVGPDARKLIPCTALVGADLVLAADLIGRVVFAPGEMPVGVLMALLGAPFFLAILLKGGRRDA
ncbi:MAG: iron ABC transporter permease [Clostridia bacterium]|nr:iron ABC transporter permease [Clostridia bacterium]